MNILISFVVIVTTLTSFAICYVNNHPFINPNFTNEERITRINE